jgi:hypothetical protein
MRLHDACSNVAHDFEMGARDLSCNHGLGCT